MKSEFRIGDYIKYDAITGSYGKIETFSSGIFYGKYYYGLDIDGNYMTDTFNFLPDDLSHIRVSEKEFWKEAVKCGFSGSISEKITEEIIKSSKWGKYNSCHEALAVLLEEVDELKEQVWINQTKRSKVNLLKECIQVAAVATKFANQLDEDYNDEFIRK